MSSLPPNTNLEQLHHDAVLPRKKVSPEADFAKRLTVIVVGRVVEVLPHEPGDQLGGGEAAWKELLLDLEQPRVRRDG